MIKSIKPLLKISFVALLILSTTATTEAGLIPWTYNAIFGPVGSSYRGYRAYRPVVSRRAYYYAGYSNVCCGTNSCYTTSYAPYYTGYGVSGCNACGCSPCGCNPCGCNTCGYASTSGCSTCGFGCATGNCSSGLTTTPSTSTNSTTSNTNSTNSNTSTPTTTFKSSDPEVNKEAIDSQKNSGNNSLYDETKNGGFEMPSRNGSNTNEGSTEENKDNAPPFNFNSSGIEHKTLRVPAAPMVPVEKEKVDNETSSEETFLAPRLDLGPAPVAIEGTELSRNVKQVQMIPTRVTRSARYHVPAVARANPLQHDLVPPLPVQVAEK